MPKVARRSLLLGSAASLLGSGAATAHHGWGGYDAGSPVDVTGTVRESSYGNPHASMMLSAADKTWEVILAPPSRMRSRGVTEAMIAKGTTLEAYGYPSRSDPTHMRAEWIKVAGTTYQLR